MNFEENKNESLDQNVRNNRKTLILLFAMFMTPVILAYSAYFGHWFDGASGANGTLISKDDLLDIEDFEFIRANGEMVSGKEFETLYWWLIPLQSPECDSECIDLNLFAIYQTYIGLGKEAKRINLLAVIPQGESLPSEKFPYATSLFSTLGVKAKDQTHSGKGKDLPANAIYLVDPLGNIFMRYPLIKSKEEAPAQSTKLRKDILHLFKYSRLG